MLSSQLSRGSQVEMWSAQMHPFWEKNVSLARRFTKSVIRSRAALTYAEAQTRLDDDRLHDEVRIFEASKGCNPKAHPSAV